MDYTEFGKRIKSARLDAGLTQEQLAREVELALPVELSREQNISLAREYVKDNFVTSGMCADLCVHDKNDGNPHAHIMLTLRPFNEDKSRGDKQKKEYILMTEQGNINREIRAANKSPPLILCACAACRSVV